MTVLYIVLSVFSEIITGRERVDVCLKNSRMMSVAVHETMSGRGGVPGLAARVTAIGRRQSPAGRQSRSEICARVLRTHRNSTMV
jgi:hypothetical protein